jgi:hypothetical protein
MYRTGCAWWPGRRPAWILCTRNVVSCTVPAHPRPRRALQNDRLAPPGRQRLFQVERARCKPTSLDSRMAGNN